MDDAIVSDIRTLIRKKEYLFTVHAGDRMTERHISVKEVEEALTGDAVEVIEDYRDDQ